jgi:hypothetical protein
VSDKLPLIFANWTIRRRLRALSKLRSALHADKILHPGNFCGGDLLRKPKTDESGNQESRNGNRSEIPGLGIISLMTC